MSAQRQVIAGPRYALSDARDAIAGPAPRAFHFTNRRGSLQSELQYVGQDF